MTVQKDTPHMPLKQPTLATSLGRQATRRLSRVGSHNANWYAIESDDVIELLVDCSPFHDDAYWKTLLKLRGLSRAFRRVVNAKLDTLLADFRAKADAARAEFALLTDSSYPYWYLGELEWGSLEWIKQMHLARESDPTSAFWKYSVCMHMYGHSLSIIGLLLKHNCTTGFWLHRDELLAWRFEVCVKCHRKRNAIATLRSNLVELPRLRMVLCCSKCCRIGVVGGSGKGTIDTRANAIVNTRPHTRALSELLGTRKYARYPRFWVEPIPGIQPEHTLLGASGMAQADVDRLASKEAERVSAAIEVRRTTRRDAAVAKLEAMAEAYLSNVPSIPTLERLQDLEAFYNVSHAIPPRPLPPYRELPLSSVRFKDCMSLFHQNVKDLA